MMLLTACSDDTQPLTDDREETEASGKTSFSLVVTAPASTTTRMADAYTQHSVTSTVGVGNISLVAVMGSDVDYEHVKNGDTFLQNINLNSAAATSGINYYRNVSFPTDDYRKVRYLFYGVNSNCLNSLVSKGRTGSLTFPNYTSLAAQGKQVNSTDALIGLTPIPLYSGSGDATSLQALLKELADSVDKAVTVVADSFATVNQLIIDSLNLQKNEYYTMAAIVTARDTLQSIQNNFDAVRNNMVPHTSISSDNEYSSLVTHLRAINTVIDNAASFYVYDADASPKYNASTSLVFPSFSNDDVEYLRTANTTAAGGIYRGTFTTFLASLDRFLNNTATYTNANHTTNSVFRIYVSVANDVTYDADTRFVGKTAAELEALMNFYLESASESENETTRTFCENLLSDYYKVTDNSIYGSIYGIELYLASTYKCFSILLSPQYNGRYSRAVKAVTDAIAKMGTLGSGINTGLGSDDYYVKLNSIYSNLVGENPLGAYSLRLIKGSPKANLYELSNWCEVTPSLEIVIEDSPLRSQYCYIPSLAYYGNGYITACDQTVDETDWVDSVYNRGRNGIANPAYSPHVAFSHTIHYGVGMLDLNLKRAAAGITFSTVTGGTMTDVDGRYDLGTLGRVTTDSIFLKGIIIGGQPKKAGFDFLPAGTDKAAIYDCDFSNVSGLIPSLTVGTYIAGTAYKKSYTNVLPVTAAGYDLYTLALPTAKDGYPQGEDKDSVLVAFEFINGCSKYLIGANNELIYPGSVFYVLGVIDRPSATPIYKYPRVFNSDVTTKVEVTLPDFSYTGNPDTWKKNLYTTVPNMQKGKVDFSLYLTEGWVDGIWGETVVGR